MDESFLNYTASKGNDLSSVVKPGDKWCICQDRYYEAYKNNKSPKIVYDSTHNFLKPYVKTAILDEYIKNKIKKQIIYKKNKICKSKTNKIISKRNNIK